MKKVSIFILLLLSFSVFAQKNKGKTNWLQEKNQYTARWRVGVGLDVIEPTGVDVQFYRLSKICTGDFSITKKVSIGLYAGREGLLAGKLVEKGNTSWSSGGNRYGIDLKFYIPIILNPYFGFGVEGGTRNFNGKSDFYPDGVARIGIEQKVLGIKLSSTSSLNATIFVDAKYNKCLTEDFSYILPCFGVRFHFL
ncbi:MAG: hypothetical protein AB9846_13730 [Tenuifilaceae bacterium]